MQRSIWLPISALVLFTLASIFAVVMLCREFRQQNAASPVVHDHSHATPRSPEWPAVRANWLKTHPQCVGCGTRTHLEVHHILPFHLFPELELNPHGDNLITLCTSPGHNCHLYVGHAGDFSAYNPDVVKDAIALSELYTTGPPTAIAAYLESLKAKRKFTR